jgi:DNA-binding transcriptional ArsR family regulator
VTTDDLFDALSHARRRAVLSYLHDADDDVAAVSELVDRVTRQEADRTGDRRETVAVALYHKHLPKLAAAELLDYDSRSGTVRYRGQSALGRETALADCIAGDLS